MALGQSGSMEAVSGRSDKQAIGATGYLGACLAALLYLGLLARGANSASLAALLSALLSVVAAVALVLSPPKTISRLLRRNLLAAFALSAFICYCVATTMQNALLPNHPFWAAVGLSGPASIAPYRTIEGLASLLGPVAAYTAAACCASSRANREAFFRTLIWLSIPFAIYALAEYSSGADDNDRLTARLDNPNSAALAFGTLGILATAGLLRATGRSGEHFSSILKPALVVYRAPFTTVALALSTTCLLLTASRGGMIATLVGWAVFLSLIFIGASTTQRRKWLFVIAVLVVSIGVIAWQGSDFVLRRFAESGANIASRQELIAAHWEAFLQRPALGHGLNTFHEINSHIATPENWDTLKSAGAAHNIYLQLVEETGLIGGILLSVSFLWILLGAILAAFRSGSGAAWSSAAVGAAAATLVQGLFDFGLQTPALACLLMAWLGASAPLRKRRDRETGVEPTRP